MFDQNIHKIIDLLPDDCSRYHETLNGNTDVCAVPISVMVYLANVLVVALTTVHVRAFKQPPSLLAT